MKAKGAFGGNDNVEAFTVLEVHTICAPIQRLSLPSHVLDSFGDLTFADNYDSNKKDSGVIDILVGLDHYCSL